MAASVALGRADTPIRLSSAPHAEDRCVDIGDYTVCLLRKESQPQSVPTYDLVVSTSQSATVIATDVLAAHTTNRSVSYVRGAKPPFELRHTHAPFEASYQFGTLPTSTTPRIIRMNVPGKISVANQLVCQTDDHQILPLWVQGHTPRDRKREIAKTEQAITSLELSTTESFRNIALNCFWPDEVFSNAANTTNVLLLYKGKPLSFLRNVSLSPPNQLALRSRYPFSDMYLKGVELLPDGFTKEWLEEAMLTEEWSKFSLSERQCEYNETMASLEPFPDENYQWPLVRPCRADRPYQFPRRRYGRIAVHDAGTTPAAGMESLRRGKHREVFYDGLGDTENRGLSSAREDLLFGLLALTDNPEPLEKAFREKAWWFPEKRDGAWRYVVQLLMATECLARPDANVALYDETNGTLHVRAIATPPPAHIHENSVAPPPPVPATVGLRVRLLDSCHLPSGGVVLLTSIETNPGSASIAFFAFDKTGTLTRWGNKVHTDSFAPAWTIESLLQENAKTIKQITPFTRLLTVEHPHPRPIPQPRKVTPSTKPAQTPVI